MPECIHKAMGEVNRLSETKVGHVTAENVRRKTAPEKPTSGKGHTRIIEIQGCDIQASSHKFNDLPTTSTANLQYGRTIGAQILRGSLLNEIRFWNCFVAEGHVPVSGGVVTITLPEWLAGMDLGGRTNSRRHYFLSSSKLSPNSSSKS
jgi:hypothetical protein